MRFGIGKKEAAAGSSVNAPDDVERVGDVGRKVPGRQKFTQKRSPTSEKGGYCSLKKCFGWSFCTLFIVGIFFILAWVIGENPQKPGYSIEKFYVPALDKTTNDTTNTTITVNLQFRNRNKYAQVNYESLNFTLYYGANRRASIGNFSIPGFRQGAGLRKRTRKVGTVKVNGVPWKTTFEKVSNGTAMVFRVEMLAAVKYDLFFSKSKLHKVSLGADVAVNDQGSKTGKRVIVLSTGSASICNSAFVGIVSAIGAYLMF